MGRYAVDGLATLDSLSWPRELIFHPVVKAASGWLQHIDDSVELTFEMRHEAYSPLPLIQRQSSGFLPVVNPDVMYVRKLTGFPQLVRKSLGTKLAL